MRSIAQWQGRCKEGARLIVSCRPHDCRERKPIGRRRRRATPLTLRGWRCDPRASPKGAVLIAPRFCCSRRLSCSSSPSRGRRRINRLRSSRFPPESCPAAFPDCPTVPRYGLPPVDSNREAAAATERTLPYEKPPPWVDYMRIRLGTQLSTNAVR